MKLELKHIGVSMGFPSKIITLKITNGETIMISDITNSKGLINEEFISNLQDIVDELRLQNDLIENNQ